MQIQQNSALKKIKSTLNHTLINSLEEVEETVRDLQSFIQAATIWNCDLIPMSTASYRIEPIQSLYNKPIRCTNSKCNCFKDLIIQQVKKAITDLAHLSTEEKKSYIFNKAISHNDLIQCLQALYPNRPDDGICHGFSLMGMQAILTKNLDQFTTRLKKLAAHLNNPTANKSFKEVIQAIQNENDFDLLAFFEGLELCSRGDFYSEIFNEEAHPHSQLNDKFIHTMLSLVSSQKLESVAINSTEDLPSRKKMIEIAETSGAYTYQELLQLFSSLQDTINQVNFYSDPIALLIKNFCHSCVIGYDPVSRIWTFIDANRVFPQQTHSIEQLTKFVRSGLNSQHYRHTFMHTSVYATKLEFRIWSQLFLRWKNSRIFKAIHKIHQKAPLKNRARLLIASRYNDEESAKALTRKKIDVNATIPLYKWTPLYLASVQGHTETAQSLLESGANINHPCNGETPLFAGAMMGHVGIVQLLMKYGADISQCNQNGVSPLKVARIKGNNTIAHILEEATTRKRKSESISQEVEETAEV